MNALNNVNSTILVLCDLLPNVLHQTNVMFLHNVIVFLIPIEENTMENKSLSGQGGHPGRC